MLELALPKKCSGQVEEKSPVRTWGRWRVAGVVWRVVVVVVVVVVVRGVAAVLGVGRHGGTMGGMGTPIEVGVGHLPQAAWGRYNRKYCIFSS